MSDGQQGHAEAFSPTSVVSLLAHIQVAAQASAQQTGHRPLIKMSWPSSCSLDCRSSECRRPWNPRFSFTKR